MGLLGRSAWSASPATSRAAKHLFDQVHGVHVRDGEVPASWIRDRFIVRHIDEHVVQLEAAAAELADQVLRMFETLKDQPSFGYEINMYRHGLQAASLMLRDGQYLGADVGTEDRPCRVHAQRDEARAGRACQVEVAELRGVADDVEASAVIPGCGPALAAKEIQKQGPTHRPAASTA